MVQRLVRTLQLKPENNGNIITKAIMNGGMNLEKWFLRKRAITSVLMTKDVEDRKYYTRCLNDVKNAVLKANNNEIWDNICRQIDQNIGYSRASEAWRTLKSLRTDRKETASINLIPLK